MTRSVFYRLKDIGGGTPGDWVRATGVPPFDITSLTGGEIYEIDNEDGTLVERTPTAAASLTYIDSFGFSDQSFTSTPSFSVDLSSALAGDKIMVVYSSSAALADMHTTLTIGGNSAGAAVANRGGLSNNRSGRVWEYTMPGNGTAGTTFALSGGLSASTNLMGVLIVRGGTVVSTGHVQNSNVTSLSTTITPANANNIIFACRFGFGSMGTVAWTSTITTTDFYVEDRITGGYVEDVAAGSPLTVTVTNSSSRTGCLIILSVEPV